MGFMPTCELTALFCIELFVVRLCLVRLSHMDLLHVSGKLISCMI